MRKAQNGDKVKIHLVGQVENGGTFATTGENAPIQFELGKSNLIEGIQEAVIGMEPKEQKTTKVPSNKAFGPHREDLIKEVNKELLPEDVRFEKGKTVKVPLSSGQMGDAKVLDVSDSTVTLDLNHPLAGKNLIFDISLLEIL
ncbi:MAG: peptidylprolyl isomerase [bacterium]